MIGMVLMQWINTMGMHKGILGQQFGGATVGLNDKTLGDYINRKYKHDAFEAVAQESFESWWEVFSKRYSLDDADSLKTDFKECWNASRA